MYGAQRVFRLTFPCATIPRRMVRRRTILVPAIITLALVNLLLTGCGIGFGSGSPSTELFKELRVFQDPNGSSSMQFELDYRQPYVVDVEVVCRLYHGSERLEDIVGFMVPANAAGGIVGEVTPVPGTFKGSFPMPPPGRYQVTCLTPADDNNRITTVFESP